jgi:hypothetical protein
MSLISRLSNLKSHSSIRRARERRSINMRLIFEHLEDRLCLSSPGLPSAVTTPDAATQSRISQEYGQLPLSFEANQGQTDASVNFLSRGSGYALFLTPTAAVLALQPPVAIGSASSPPPAATSQSDQVLRMDLVGANAQAPATGLDAQGGTSNYFVGNDSSQWQTSITNYGEVEYQNVYRGINLIYYGNQRQLEYDFVVAPGASPGSIQLAFTGAAGTTLDSSGDLVLHTSGGDVIEHAPVIYQDSSGVRQAVSGHYVLEPNGQVGFEVGSYDPAKPLVIDPVLSYSTYLGGSGDDFGDAIAVDSAGDAYVTGYTTSPNFPTQNSIDPYYDLSYMAFVTKFNATGTAQVYSSYLGSGGMTYSNAIAVDGAGNAYVTGLTNSNTFPTTPGAFQTASGGVFVTKLNPTGSALVYSTRLGGNVGEEGNGIAVDSTGRTYVTGWTESTNFPTTSGAFQTTPGGAFVTEFNASGTALVYSTYLGLGADQADAIALDGAGEAFVTGYSNGILPTTPGAFQTTGAGVFVTKLNAAGTALVYSTFLGYYGGDVGYGIAVDGAGDAYVTGNAPSSTFPTTAGAFSTLTTGAFVAKLNASGTALVYSTYLGVAGSKGRGIALDSAGDAFVAGGASSRLPGAHNGVFVVDLNATGTALVSSDYLGAIVGDSAYGIAVDGNGNAYVAGWTRSTNFPTTPGAFQTTYGGGTSDAFVAKIAFNLQATTLAVGGFPSPDTAGTTGTFTVTANNASGGVNTGYTGTIHFTSSDPHAVLPADYTFTGADRGVHTFGATLKTAGTQSVTAADTTNGVVGSETGVVVNPAAVSTFNLTGYPSPTTAGLAGTFTLMARDAFGNLATGYTGTVHFSSSDGMATLPANYAFKSADAGVHTFSATLKTAGAQSLTAIDTVTATIVGSETGIVVKPAAASEFVVSAPSTVTHGVAFTLTLTVEDAYGNLVTGYRGTVHFSSSDNTAVLPPNYTFTAADGGRHTFTNKMTLKKKGKQTFTATDTLRSALAATTSINVT